MFVSLEGPDGVGKTTQAALLAERIRAHGLEVVQCREPGGTELGERVRAILLDPAATMGDRAEALLGARRFLAGSAAPTEADLRLFCTLIRFDEVYVVYFKTNKRMLREYPNLLNYTKARGPLQRKLTGFFSGSSAREPP